MTITSNTPARIVVVDDRPASLKSLELSIQNDPRFILERTFLDVSHARSYIISTVPDIVLLDIVFPKTSGISILKEIRAARPDLLIAMLTAFDTDEFIFDSLMAGADGYILKSDTPDEIREGLFILLRGGAPISAPIARRVLRFFRERGQVRHESDASASDLKSLTSREAQILALVAEGYTAKEVASRIEISSETVRVHLKRVYKKLHVYSRQGAVARFLASKNFW
jgi:DNA-binding NarL/FixJ family response regulator